MTPEELDAEQRRLGVPVLPAPGVQLPPGVDVNAPMQTRIDLNAQPTAPPMQPNPLLGQAPQEQAAPVQSVAPPPLITQPSVAPPPAAAPSSVTQVERDVQIAPKLTQAQKTAEAEAFAKTQAAEDRRAQLESDKAATVAAEKEATERKLAEQRAKDEAQAADIKKKSDVAFNDWQKKREEADAASREKEPTESLGQRIVQAIAIGMGSYSSSINGGPNQAAMLIKDARERRIREMERQASQARGRVADSANIYQMYRQQGLDQLSAQNAVRLRLIDDENRHLDSVTAGFSNKEILARRDALKASNEEERQRILNQQALSEQNREVRKYVTGPAATQNPTDARAQRALEVEVPQGEGGKDGIKKFYAKTDQEARAIRDAQKVALGINSDLKAMNALIAGHPTINPQTAQKVEILNNSIRKKYIKLDELGVPTGKDLELSSVIGDPTSWKQTRSQTRDLIRRTERDAAQRLQQAYEAQGFRE